jgi:transposase
MGQNFKPYEPDQLYLMPPALSEWVSEGSLARFVSDVVERLDSEGALQPFYAAYRPDGRGRAAYAPLMMVKVLLYGYCKGITSSRRLAEALESDVGFRYLAANQQPNFRTISDFRKDHLEALSGLFVRLLQLCQEAGLMKMGRVALDGTKVPGNAALAANRTRAQLEAEVARVFEEAEATDREEDARYGVDMRGDELPQGLRTPAERAARLQAAVDRLKAEEEQAKAAQAEKIRVREEEERRQGRKKRGRKPKAPESMKDPERRANTTDPESRIMKTQRGWMQGYNAQAAPTARAR